MIKRILCLSIFIILIFTFVGCSDSTMQTVDDTKDDINTSIFVEVETNSLFKIVYHKDTKVMYTISKGYYNQGTFTVMLDADGKPMLYEEK